MRVVFLDFDGVIATETSYNRWRKAAWLADYGNLPRARSSRIAMRQTLPPRLDAASWTAILDTDCCARVQRLCDLVGAQIVISSSWRHSFNLDVLRTMLRTHGVVAEVLCVTPDDPGLHRGTEIAVVAADLGLAPADLVVLEDVEDVRPFNGRCVRPTFHGNRAGLQDRHLERARALFGVRPVT